MFRAQGLLFYGQRPLIERLGLGELALCNKAVGWCTRRRGSITEPVDMMWCEGITAVVPRALCRLRRIPTSVRVLVALCPLLTRENHTGRSSSPLSRTFAVGGGYKVGAISWPTVIFPE